MMVNATQHAGIQDLASTQLNVRRDVPLAPYTTYKVGGPAALFIELESVESAAPLLTRLEELDIAWLVLGKGSNVLISDAGFDGAVIQLGKGFAHHSRPESPWPWGP